MQSAPPLLTGWLFLNMKERKGSFFVPLGIGDKSRFVAVLISCWGCEVGAGCTESEGSKQGSTEPDDSHVWDSLIYMKRNDTDSHVNVNLNNKNGHNWY